MKLLEKTIVNLDSNVNLNMLGHISTYRKRNGNIYRTYFIEERFFAAKEFNANDELIFSYNAVDEYHYSIDINFENKNRWLGWI